MKNLITPSSRARIFPEKRVTFVVLVLLVRNDEIIARNVRSTDSLYRSRTLRRHRSYNGCSVLLYLSLSPYFLPFLFLPSVRPLHFPSSGRKFNNAPSVFSINRQHFCEFPRTEREKVNRSFEISSIFRGRVVCVAA